MNINFDKIKYNYDDSVLELINNNIEDCLENITYLKNIGFDNYEEIFENFTLIFIEDPADFKEKINNFINEIGSNYIEVLNNNMELWFNLF